MANPDVCCGNCKYMFHTETENFCTNEESYYEDSAVGKDNYCQEYVKKDEAKTQL